MRIYAFVPLVRVVLMWCCESRSRSAPVMCSDNVLSSSHMFACLCGSGSSASSSLGGTPQGIARFMQSTSKVMIPSTSASGCNGQIRITVDDDYSHPLGIKGHRISIDIEH